MAECSREVWALKGYRCPGRVITLMEMGPSAPTGGVVGRGAVHGGAGRCSGNFQKGKLDYVKRAKEGQKREGDMDTRPR